MKIVVTSDTHGITGCLEDALMKVEDINLIIHLGDYVRDALKLENESGIKVEYVRGNCDYNEVNVEEEKVIKIENKKIFMTHGHLYDIKMGLNRIFYRGQELNCDVVLFGHSHIPTKVEEQEILLLNPGSPTIPRGGSKKSIGIIEIINDKIESKIITI